MRYYVYASDAKLDMLAPQVPRKLREKVAAEMTVDLKLLSVSLKERPSEESRYAKIELVRQHLMAEGQVGGLEDEAGWFEGMLPMHWGPFLHHEPRPADGGPREYDRLSPMVFFAGRTGSMQLGLGGSRTHLLGTPTSSSDEAARVYGNEPLFTSYSDGYAILDAVGNAFEGEPVRPIAGEAVSTVVNRVMAAHEIVQLPPAPVEFLALRLLDTEIRGRRVILGTPLYVART